MDQAENLTMKRLEDQILWYDSRSGRAQRSFKTLKVVQMVGAGLIPVLAILDLPFPPEKAAALLGLVVLVVEGLQQLNQYQHLWLAYRSTCEALRHEKYIFLASAGPYAKAANPISILAERVEGLISQEHAKWVSAQETASKQKDANL